MVKAGAQFWRSPDYLVAMVDAAIVMIEAAHKHLERAPPGKPRLEVLTEAAAEVGPALFFSLLIITVSFLPIFTMESQEGRLFSPLAFTKTFSMAAASYQSASASGCGPTTPTAPRPTGLTSAATSPFT